MTEAVTAGGSGEPGSPRPAPRVAGLGGYGALAVVFIFLTLIALVVVPLLVNQRVVRLRGEIEASEPARTMTNQLQYSLVRQMSSLSELLLSGDESAVVAFVEARENEEEIYAGLGELVHELGPDVEERYREVLMLAESWHRASANEDVFEERADAPALTPVPRARERFEELLRATGDLDGAILSSTGAARLRIERAESVGLTLTVALAFFALLAAGFVVMLAGRTRRLAEEASRRRALAEAALEETAQAQRARERLIRGITHDVKNPLGAARGYAELLALGVKVPLLPEQEPLVAGVQRSVDNALRIIADLLDVARADSGGLSVRSVRTDLVAVISDAALDHRASAEMAGHSIEMTPPGRGIQIDTDPARVRQVLDNLLSNAIKYTPSPGRIQVRMEVLRDAGAARDDEWVAVRVIDNGPGIPAPLREKIFDEFTRIEEGGSMQGHGLGLAIARRLARLLGGDLEAIERAEPGAEFVLWLPLAPPPSA